MEGDECHPALAKIWHLRVWAAELSDCRLAFQLGQLAGIPATPMRASVGRQMRPVEALSKSIQSTA